MNKSELIHYLIHQTNEGHLVTKQVKGYTLWTVWEQDGESKIVAYQLKRQPDAAWTYETEYETTPPSTLTCPEIYLTKTAVLCKDWRRKIVEYCEKPREAKAKIRRLFKVAEKENKTLKVKIKAKEGYGICLHSPPVVEVELIIEEVRPGVTARYPKNGRRYSVPLRLVTDITLTDKED